MVSSKKNQSAMTLPIRVRNEMINDIMLGIIRPGGKIGEEIYAEKLNVSRAPVREAMAMLVIEGVAEKTTNKGTYLKAYSLQDHIDLYNLRFFLERQALQKLSHMADITPLLHDLNKYINRMKKDTKNINQISVHNYSFHYALIQHSNSRVLIEKYPSLYISINFFQQEAYIESMDEIYHPLSDHENLVTALKTGDFTNALEISDKHHQGIIDLLLRYSQKEKAIATIE